MRIPRWAEAVATTDPTTTPLDFGGLITTQAAAGSVVGTPHNTRTDYMLNLRFAVGVLNGSGANTETGNLTAYAALKFWT